MNQVAASADVADSASIGRGTSIWGIAQLRESVIIGDDCTVGRGAYLGVGVRVGDRVKIQNLAQIYEPAVIEDGAFIGPAAILTNDQYPRAVTPSGERATGADWNPVGVTVREGASIGARVVCVAPVEIGRWAMVGAGATVVRDVPDYALVVGSPAKFVAWVGRSGHRLLSVGDELWECPKTGQRYRQSGGRLQEVGE